MQKENGNNVYSLSSTANVINLGSTGKDSINVNLGPSTRQTGILTILDDYKATQPQETVVASKPEPKAKPKAMLELHVKEEDNTYTKLTVVKGKEISTPISNFIIVANRLIQWMDTDENFSLVCKICYDDGSIETKILNADNFNSKMEFKKAISSYMDCFLGDDNDVHQIKVLAFREAEDLERVSGYKTGGFVKPCEEWIFVTQDGALFPDGSFMGNIVQGNGHGQKSNILSQRSLDKEELRALGEFIFEFNTKTISYTIISYIAALFLKEIMYAENGIKFPHLLLTGESGSGKSSTYEKIIAPILSIIGSPANATGLTRYAADYLSNGNNTIPLVIEEYKPHLMSKEETSRLSNIARSAYDRQSNIRGTKDMKVSKLIFLSPLIIIGEASMLHETAISERSVALTVSKGESAEHKSGFNNMARSRKLGGFGRNLLEKALGSTSDEIQKSADKYRKQIDDLGIQADRLNDQLLVLMLGFGLVKKVFEDQGLDFEEITGASEEEAFKVFSENIIDENMQGGRNTKSALGQTLELMDRVISYMEPSIINTCISTTNANRGQIGICINNIYPQVDKYSRDYGNRDNYLKKDDFVSQLKKSSYLVIQQDGKKSKKLNIRSLNGHPTSGMFHFIDIKEALETGLELPNMESYLRRIE